MSTKFAHFIDRLGRLKNLSSGSQTTPWGLGWILSYVHVSSLQLTSGVFLQYVRSPLIGQLQNINSQQGFDWPTQLCHPVVCLFSNTSWACKNVFVVDFLARDFHLSQTCFSWTFWHENFTCHKRVFRGHSGTRILLVTSLLTAVQAVIL